MNSIRVVVNFGKRQVVKSLFAPLKSPKPVAQSEEYKEVKQLFYKMTEKDAIRDSIIDSHQPKQLLKQIDTNLSNYFAQRAVDIKSINFIIQAIAAQNKFEELDEVLEFMTTMRIQPNFETHLNLINAFGKFRNVEKAEQLYEIARKKYGPSLYLYNTLINVYCKNLKADTALQVFNDLKRDGFEPDIPIYTTLINSFYRVKQWDKCWDLFDEARLQSGQRPDENLLCLMIEICADTHDAEKAINLYDQMSDMEFKDTTYVFNAMIKSLGSRKDYAEKALEFFRRMLMNSIDIDSDTIVCALKACSNCGDMKIAHEVVKLMNTNKITPNKYIYNQLVRVYIGACQLPDIDQSLEEQYVADAWKVFNEAVAKNMVNQRLLNSMSELMVASNRLPDLEGLVLPLYDQYGIKKNNYTYEQIIKILYIEKRLLDLIRIFDDVKSKMQPTFNSVSCYLETAMLLADEDRVVDALEWFDKIQRLPKYKQLKQLGTMKNIPIRIHALLDQYEAKFGKVSDTIFRIERNQRGKSNNK